MLIFRAQPLLAPKESHGQAQEAKRAAGKLVEAGEDTPVLLELVDAALLFLVNLPMWRLPQEQAALLPLIVA
jgi:hypothetical protein